MIRIPGPIPIFIHPTFWVFSALIGYLISFNFASMFLWVGIIFISVLFHEMGHALTALFFGQQPRIELVALGGVTYHGGLHLPFWKQFLIIFNGPLFGFLLFIMATLLLLFLPQEGAAQAIVHTLQKVNLFWTVLNLLPVLPLDGGQLLRLSLERWLGARGLKVTLVVSIAIAGGVSLFFFIVQQFPIGALFFLLAFQSFEAWRSSRLIAEPDRSEPLRTALEEAEEDLRTGRKDEARIKLGEIRSEAKKGLIYALATQYLAGLKAEERKFSEVYQLLFPLRKELAGETLCLLQQAAFEQRDYPLVVELSGECFQVAPTADIAWRSAYACAALSQVRPAIGWLRTAAQEGLKDMNQLLAAEVFDSLRADPLFSEFLESLRKS